VEAKLMSELERTVLLAMARLLEELTQTEGSLDGEFFQHLQWGILDGSYDGAIFLAKLDLHENLEGVEGVAGLRKTLLTMPEETRAALRGGVLS
jgi:hypothetical protein